jgi:hypothetical protein
VENTGATITQPRSRERGGRRSRRRARARSRPAPRLALLALTAATVFWVAYDNGSYGIGSRSSLALAIGWALILGLGLGLFPLAPPPRAAILVGALLAGFAAWTLFSLAWTSDREATFAEFDRVVLLLGVFVLVVVASSRALLPSYLDGLTIAIVAIALVALVSRLFPSTFSDRGLGVFLPGAHTRLSFPLGYWNGLAIFVSMGLPLLLRGAASWRHAATRGAAVAGIPLVASVVYLASSRGGVVTAAVGGLVALAACRRWSVFAALAIGTIGAALAVGALATRRTLVNGPLPSPLAASQGHRAALVLVLVCVATALVYAAASHLGVRKPPDWAGWALLLLASVVLVVLVATESGRVHRLEQRFREPPSAAPVLGSNFVQAHLLSGNGSGRWQFWTAAVDEWRDRLLIGHGAGTFQFWWLAHGSIALFVRDAHSLYLQTLAELGIVGLVLLVAAFAVGAAAGVRRLGASSADDDRVAVGALLGLTVAWLVGAGIDWMWQLTVTAAVALLGFALLTGPATAPAVPAAPDDVDPPRRSPVFLRVGAIVAIWILMACSAIPWLADLRVGASQAAARRGDGAAAAADALAARNLEPWASTPYLQLALVSEQAGAPRAARVWIDRAIARSPDDWQLWLVAARLDTKLGHIAAARRELARARELNPRSPLFAALSP